MNCYNQSINLCSTARNAQLYGRTRYHQSELYESVFYDWDDCIRWLEDAKSCFEASGDYERMTMCDIKIAAIMVSHEKYINGASQLDLIKPDYLQECSDDILSKYYFVKLCPYFSFYLSVWCVFRIAYIEAVVHIFHDIQYIYWAYPITWGISSIIYMIYYKRSDWVHGFEHEKKPLFTRISEYFGKGKAEQTLPEEENE